MPDRSSSSSYSPGRPAATVRGAADLPYAGFTWREAEVVAVAVLLLGAISVNSFFASSGAPEPTLDNLARVAVSDVSYFFLWGLCAFPVFWVCAHLRPDRQSWPAAVVGHVAVATGVMAVVELAHSAFCASVISGAAVQPIATLTDLFFLRGSGQYLLLAGVGCGRDQYVRSRAKERRTKALESKLTAARLRSLRMQINPHFLHNTLHTISSMAGNDPDGIRRATARLSDLMRHALSTSDQHEVPLQDEIDVLTSYLEIQKLRLEENLVVTIGVADEARQALVPTLLLQPLAENAVKHGFEGRDEPGHLCVRAGRTGDTLVLEVSDNGRGLSEQQCRQLSNGAVNGREGNPAPDADAASRTASTPKNGGPREASRVLENGAPSPFPDDSVGLQNVARRLQGLYGDEAALAFDRSTDGGLRVTVRLPFRPSNLDGDLRTSGVAVETDGPS